MEECWVNCGSVTQCPTGYPLSDAAGGVQKCSSRLAPCPNGYDCSDVFSDAFVYGQTAVCCPTKELVCSLNVDRGSRCLGVGLTTRFFYDPLSKFCREFTFMGCAGNFNNFASKGECMKFCADKILCLMGDPLPQKASTQLLECDPANPCPDDFECIRSGKDSACCPGRAHICKLERSLGTVCLSVPQGKRWWFNSATSLCEKLAFNGCKGNLNNFATSEQCQSFCIGTCPADSEAFISPLTGQAVNCQTPSPIIGLTDNCPVGHLCTQTPQRTFVCCRRPPRCPGMSQPFLDYDGKTVACRPDPSGTPTCPRGHTCTKGLTKEFLCCATQIECPRGFLTLHDSVDLPARQCSPGVPGGCPDTFSCLPATEGTYACCRPQQVCILPYVDTTTFFALSCTPGIEAECPLQTSCLHNNVDAKYYCCHNVDYSLCPDRSIPYMQPAETVIKRCSPAGSTESLSCPANFLCTSLEDMTFGCCRKQISDVICRVAYVRANGTVIPCAKGLGVSCPDGTFCQKASDSRYYCCSK